MDWTFDNYYYFFLLLVIPLVGLFMFNFLSWRKKRRLSFAAKDFQKLLFPKSSSYKYLLIPLYLIAIVFLVFSFADLLMGKKEMKVNQKLSNVVILVDLSSSMNAEDISPSRLEREKQIITDLLHQLKTEKVGIVIFAGNAVSIMPLTTDYSAVETYISSLETNAIGHQGTNFGFAMHEAVKMYNNYTKASRNVVIISDGEDNENQVDAAISLARQNGIKITTVGIGTEQGAPVPDYMYGQLMGYKYNMYGETVISKRETQALVQMSNSTGGTYIDGNNEKASGKLLDAISNFKSDSETKVVTQSSVHYYQFFLIIAFGLFFIIYLTNPKRDLNI